MKNSMAQGMECGGLARGGAARAAAHDGGRGRAERFLEYGPAVYALMFIVLVLVISFLAPLLTPHGRDAIDLDNMLARPSAEHALGTDDLGRDLFTRLIYAGRFSMLVALCSVAIAVGIGMAMGALAGYFGGVPDGLITVVMDLFLSVPVFLVILVSSSACGGRLWLIPLIIGGTSWVETARIVRALVFSLKEEGYVEAARAAGAPAMYIVARHVLPQAFPALTVSAVVGFAQAMLMESAVSFLGFGVQPPVPTWGNMLQSAHVFIGQAPLAALAPGFMIFMTCLAFHFVGDGLRRMLAIDR